MQSLLRCETADGIIEYSHDELARDPSIVVGVPYPPGDRWFYVDDIGQISPGDKIFYSTQTENEPAAVRVAMVELHKAQKQLRLYPEGSQLYRHWGAIVTKLSNLVVDFWQGQARIKSLRTVASVDRDRKLIVVTEKFLLKPRVMGGVVRVVGFEKDFINEVATDILEKHARKQYGSTWQDDIEISRLNNPSPDGESG